MRSTDEELAAWVPTNYCPPEWGDQSARMAGVSARVLVVIKAVRAQYDRDGARLTEFNPEKELPSARSVYQKRAMTMERD